MDICSWVRVIDEVTIRIMIMIERMMMTNDDKDGGKERDDYIDLIRDLVETDKRRSHYVD